MSGLTLRRLCAAGVVAFWLAVGLTFCTHAPAAPAQSVTRGDRATWAESAGRAWCVTVGTTDTGADGRPWAWFTIDADPRRVFHAPVSELRAECSL